MPPDRIGRPGGTTETAQQPARATANSSAPPCIPELPPDVDKLTAALAYADAGLYVLPVGRGTKNPGSVVGKQWQVEVQPRPEVIAAWFAGTDHGIAMHCGRSGAVVFDVDKPELLPDAGRRPRTAPYQSTRPDVPGRGHYVFAMPSGRTIGNAPADTRGARLEASTA